MAREQPLAGAPTVSMTAMPSLAADRRAWLSKQLRAAGHSPDRAHPRLRALLPAVLLDGRHRAQDHRGSGRLSATALADRADLVQFPGRRRVLPVLAVPAQHLHHHRADRHRLGHLQPDRRLRLLPHRVARPGQDLLPGAGDSLHPLPGADRGAVRHLRQDCRARSSTAGSWPGRGTGSTPICRWSCRCSSATPSGSF